MAGSGYKGTKPDGKTRSSSNSYKGYNAYRQDEKKTKMLKMLAESGNAKRNKDGKIVQEAAFQSKVAEPGRVQADRRWFGEFSFSSSLSCSPPGQAEFSPVAKISKDPALTIALALASFI